MSVTGCTCANSCSEDGNGSMASEGDQIQQPCCCCHYNPFEDSSPESRIQDLPFALRKLSVMKCQMRKWRLERLECESQAIMLKKALQSYGVNVDEILKPDPLIVHFREENLRLDNEKQALEDQIRDLCETLAERDYCADKPSEAVAHIREKIALIRHRFAIEKRLMRETIAELQLKLQDAKDNTSCVALNRLRANLRGLMNDGKKADQQLPCGVEKSIETLAELSKSCNELRKENECLLAQVESLKKEIKEEDYGDDNYIMSYDMEKETVEISDLSRRVIVCEALVAKMRSQIADKDDTINELENKLYCERRNSTQLTLDLDQLVISQKAQTNEISAMKDELKEKDEKITKLLREQRQAAAVALGMGELESELERMRPEMCELKAVRTQLKDELTLARQQLEKTKVELKTMTEAEQHLRDLEANARQANEKLQEAYAALQSSELAMKDEARKCQDSLREHEEEVKRLLEVESTLKADLEKSRADNEALKTELEELGDDLNRLQEENQSLTENNNKISFELKEMTEKAEKLADENSTLSEEKDSLTADVARLEDKLTEETKIQENMKAEIDKLTSESDNLKETVQRQESESGDSKKEIANLKKALKKMENDCKMMESEKDMLLASMEEKRNELLKQVDSEKKKVYDLKKNLEEARKKAEESKMEIISLKKDKDELSKQVVNQAKQLQRVRSELKEAKDIGEECKMELEHAKSLDEYMDEINNLKREIEKMQAVGRNKENEITNLCAIREQLTSEKAQLESDMEIERAEKEARIAELVQQNEEGEAERDKLMTSLSHSRDETEKVSKELEVYRKQVVDQQALVIRADYEKQRLQREVGDLKWHLDKVKKDLEAQLVFVDVLDAKKAEVEKLQAQIAKVEKEKVAMTVEMNNAKNELQANIAKMKQLKSELEVLKSNKRLKSGANSSLQFEKELTNTRAELERLRKITGEMPGMKPSKPLQAGDMILAAEVLKVDIQQQIAGVGRVRDFISYVQGKAEKPTVSMKLSFNGKKWSVPEINQLFVKSKALSEAIYQAEQEIQKLEVNAKAGNEFGATAWLQSLTLPELADLHDKICTLTAKIVKDDGPKKKDHLFIDDYDDDDDEDDSKDQCQCNNDEDTRDVLNMRIVVLQRRIAEKHRKAAARATSMRVALMRELAELIRVSDEMNRKRERYLALRLSLEPSALPSLEPESRSNLTIADYCTKGECQRFECRK